MTRRARQIKTEPVPTSTSVAAAGPTQDEAASETNVSNASNGGTTNYDGSSEAMRPETAFYRRAERSHAPAPSDRVTEPEPLLRELRMRPDLMAIGTPPAVSESANFHSSFQDIGKQLKACNDTLGELQSLGVSHEVPLPELVLVGDQSAGKSSVMSGLAELDLPRSEGTCTRCPLHIRVSKSSEWSCRVSLLRQFVYEPPMNRSITDGDVTDQDPFFPWRKASSFAPTDFKTVHDKNDIEDVLRWAQIAILNDDKSHELFVPGSGAIACQVPVNQAAEETSAKFSPNIVHLEIKGPALPNLSFYDLPGIFQNPADAHDDYLVNVVRNLSLSYIRRESAIIICTMPMNTDAENSCTFSLTRRLGALPRTIGVLTKADLLPDTNNHDQWLNIMKGTAHQTGLGYFITSRPQGKDLDELKKWEAGIFDDRQAGTWPEAFGQYVDRCGVERLKDFLSRKLGEHFIRSLPHIEKQVTTRLAGLNRKLLSLPELPDNVELEIRSSLSGFTNAAKASLNDFAKHISPLPDHFKECILHIKPKFILKDKDDIPVVELSDNDSDTETTVQNGNTPGGVKRRMPPPQTPSKRQRSETPASGRSSTIKQEPLQNGQRITSSNRPLFSLKGPFAEFTKVGGGFRTLRQVRDETKEKSRAGMPNVIPEQVYESLVLESLQPWEKPMLVFLRETTTQLARELQSALTTSFQNLKKRIVFKECEKLLRSFLNEHQEKAKQAMMQIYRDETYQLLTFNEEAFERYRSEELLLLTRFRHKMRMEAIGADKKPLEEWSKLSDAKRAEDEKRRKEEILKFGEDKFTREIDIVAYIRGYYRLAALRFIDSIAQCIMCRMIPDIKKELSFYLDRKLGLLDFPDRAVFERLMEEDVHTASMREKLKVDRAKFEKALASINALNAGVIDTGDADSIIFAGGNTDADLSMDDASLAEDGY